MDGWNRLLRAPTKKLLYAIPYKRNDCKILLKLGVGSPIDHLPYSLKITGRHSCFD